MNIPLISDLTSWNYIWFDDVGNVSDTGIAITGTVKMNMMILFHTDVCKSS